MTHKHCPFSLSGTGSTEVCSVSVVMPSYNHESYIAEAIESVIRQEYSDWELIIVDDCSTDSSPEIIREYARMDSRISAIFRLSNNGVARAANDGLGRATGKYVAFHSSDDLWLPNKLRRQVDVLNGNENLVVWGDSLLIDEDGNTFPKTYMEYIGEEDTVKSGDLFGQLILRNIINAISLIHKKRGLLFDERLFLLNDYLYALHLAYHFPFRYIDEPLTMYRIHGKNITIQHREKLFLDEINLGGIALQEFPDKMTRALRATLLAKSARGYYRSGEIGASISLYSKALLRKPSLIVPHAKDWLSRGLGKDRVPFSDMQFRGSEEE